MNNIVDKVLRVFRPKVRKEPQTVYNPQSYIDKAECIRKEFRL